MHQLVEKNPYAKFQLNSSAGYGEDVITGKTQDAQQRPYLSMNLNQIHAGLFKPFGEHSRQVSKKHLKSGLAVHVDAISLLQF